MPGPEVPVTRPSPGCPCTARPPEIAPCARTSRGAFSSLTVEQRTVIVLPYLLWWLLERRSQAIHSEHVGFGPHGTLSGSGPEQHVDGHQGGSDGMLSEATLGAVVDGRDDDALVAAAVRDREEFAVLYERYRLPVYRYLRARGADDDLALDLTADTFERALRSLGRYRPRAGGFAAWLLRIARNARVDDRRRTARLVPLPDAGPASADQANPDLAIDLRRLVAGLPAPTREAIALRYAAGLTASEIGVVLGKRPEAVQKLIERGLETLREGLR
jgi:RNA polymerase sigma-70 factor, ECF subfamily